MPDDPNVAELGRFRARYLPVGALRYHGLRGDFTRQPTEYEAERPGVEIYDTRHPHTPLGQFVSSYYVATLLEHPLTRLNLQGDVPAWTMDQAETAGLVEFLRARLAADES